MSCQLSQIRCNWTGLDWTRLRSSLARVCVADMLGVQPRSVVRGNLVHDSHPYFMYGHGIYLDEGASGINVTQNWVHTTFAASWMQHYGVNNTVSSNVFAKAIGHCLTYTSNPTGPGKPPQPDSTMCPGYIWHPAYRGQLCGYTLERNIFLAHPNSSSDGGADAHRWHESVEGICNVTSQHNIYWNTSGTFLQLISACTCTLLQPGLTEIHHIYYVMILQRSCVVTFVGRSR